MTSTERIIRDFHRRRKKMIILRAIVVIGISLMYLYLALLFIYSSDYPMISYIGLLLFGFYVFYPYLERIYETIQYLRE